MSGYYLPFRRPLGDVREEHLSFESYQLKAGEPDRLDALQGALRAWCVALQRRDANRGIPEPQWVEPKNRWFWKVSALDVSEAKKIHEQEVRNWRQQRSNVDAAVVQQEEAVSRAAEAVREHYRATLSGALALESEHKALKTMYATLHSEEGREDKN